MDILNLVNKLEELFSQGRSLPFTHNVVINEDQMIDLISRNMKKDEKIVTKRIIDSFSWDNSVRIFDQYLRRK